MTNKSSEAVEVKELLGTVWNNLKELSTNLIKLYGAIQSFVKELTDKSEETEVLSETLIGKDSADITQQKNELIAVEASAGSDQVKDSAPDNKTEEVLHASESIRKQDFPSGMEPEEKEDSLDLNQSFEISDFSAESSEAEITSQSDSPAEPFKSSDVKESQQSVPGEDNF